MIIINGQQKTVHQIAKDYGVPLDKLQKSSEFKYNESLKGYDLGSRSKRSPGGLRWPASFHGTDSKGMDVEIRYAKSQNKIRDKAGMLMDVFSPKKVEFTGDIDIPETLEEAVYKYLHPKCAQSPFRANSNVPFTYEYDDKQKRSESTIKKGDVMLEALQHAKKYNGLDLKLMAKGLNIQNVDNMEELEIHAALSELAMKDPASYLKKAALQGTIFDGRIIDAIDSGLFIKKETFGIERWEWNAGINKGQLICEVTNKSVSPQEFLRTHIKNHINEYYAQITNVQNAIAAEQKAEAFLSQQVKLQEEEVPVVVQEQIYEEAVPLNMAVPTSFNEAVSFIQARTYENKRPSNVIVSPFWKAIQSGEVHEGNIEEAVQELLS